MLAKNQPVNWKEFGDLRQFEFEDCNGTTRRVRLSPVDGELKIDDDGKCKECHYTIQAVAVSPYGRIWFESFVGGDADGNVISSKWNNDFWGWHLECPCCEEHVIGLESADPYISIRDVQERYKKGLMSLAEMEMSLEMVLCD